MYKRTFVVSVEELDSEIPVDYKLEQNFPNPFNPTTTIQFSIPELSFVKIEVFNTLGEKVTTLVSEELFAGNYKYEWIAENLPSGIYFYKMKADSYEQTKKLVLLFILNKSSFLFLRTQQS
ncbi:MAG: T9SS C-terminal target domain-containing protein [Ignavibacteria bacterium CHB3]|nr:T9SS C-terminal target domain-containing protein [Ignavibacteria bacterium CHB3]